MQFHWQQSLQRFSCVTETFKNVFPVSVGSFFKRLAGHSSPSFSFRSANRSSVFGNGAVIILTVCHHPVSHHITLADYKVQLCSHTLFTVHAHSAQCLFITSELWLWHHILFQCRVGSTQILRLKLCGAMQNTFKRFRYIRQKCESCKLSCPNRSNKTNRRVREMSVKHNLYPPTQSHEVHAGTHLQRRSQRLIWKRATVVTVDAAQWPTKANKREACYSWTVTGEVDVSLEKDKSLTEWKLNCFGKMYK